MTTIKAVPYLVIETFTSIQGEGTRIGRLSTFLRLANCNLACTWCDTTYSWKKGEMVEPTRMNAHELAAHVAAPDVVITGGEPLLHDLTALLDELPDRFVTVETNATIYRPDPRVGLWSLSPKLGTSGQADKLKPDVIARYLELSPEAVQLKFVVAGAEDLAAVKVLLLALPEAVFDVPLILQPVGVSTESRDDYCEKMRAFVEEELLTDPFWQRTQLRFLPQFHRLLWRDKRGI